MRKDVLLLPVLVLGVVISGCSGSLSDASDYGEEIFKCDPDNILGFEGAFIEGERVTLVFDEEYASDGDYPVITRYYFREEQIPSRDHLTVYTAANDPVVTDSNEIEVDADAMTISFEVSLPKGDKITGVAFNYGDARIMFDDALIEVSVIGGECVEDYTQRYDEHSDSWGEVEYDVVVWPMICEDDPE